VGDPLVSVIIPTTTQAHALDQCLALLLARLPAEVAVEVVVVLNGATPEVERVADRYSDRIRLTRSAINLGIAGGFNRGRAVASGRFLVSLHDDAFIEPGWLEALLAAAADHPEAGLFCSLVMDPDGTPQSVGTLIWRSGHPTAPWLDHPPPAADFTTIEPIQAGGSSSLMVRAAVFDAIGGLDERLYPGFFVDLDLAMAVWEAGRTVLLVPDSRARHLRNSSTTRRYRYFLYERNHRHFAAKWAAELAQRPIHARTEERLREAKAWLSERAARLAAGYSRQPEMPAARLRFDPTEQAERTTRLALEVAEAYGATLESELEEQARVIAEREIELARVHAQLGDLAAGAGALTERLRALEASRWQRLYRRLLPVLEPLVRRLGKRPS
jgi:GT2 family glycosyltransferase